MTSLSKRPRRAASPSYSLMLQWACISHKQFEYRIIETIWTYTHAHVSDVTHILAHKLISLPTESHTQTYKCIDSTHTDRHTHTQMRKPAYRQTHTDSCISTDTVTHKHTHTHKCISKHRFKHTHIHTFTVHTRLQAHSTPSTTGSVTCVGPGGFYCNRENNGCRSPGYRLPWTKRKQWQEPGYHPLWLHSFTRSLGWRDARGGRPGSRRETVCKM